MNQTASATQKAAIGETGIWVFILADMCIFALYFFVFAWDKSLHSAQFIQGQASLNTTLGATNTVILLLSSCFMAKAVHAARLFDIAHYARYIRLTILCGCVFLVIKAYEYSEKLTIGYHVATNEFYSDYFAFTGLHMLHVITGLCVLIYSLQFASRDQSLKTHTRFIENSGLYWHMVDLLWVVLFTFIYLVP
jgi:nitric oxide reductase NorE protein